MDTAKHGFYINKGVLEFRHLDDWMDSSIEQSEDENEGMNEAEKHTAKKRGRKRKEAPIREEEDGELSAADIIIDSDNIGTPSPIAQPQNAEVTNNSYGNYTNKAAKNKKKEVGFLKGFSFSMILVINYVINYR